MMSEVTKERVQLRPTLARRVSDMFRDGNYYSGPPLLFRHASMQRLRHCCQNLNLFPYLLYSFGNSKSHPAAQKIRLYFALLLKNLLATAQSLSRTFHRKTIRVLIPGQEATVQEQLEKPLPDNQGPSRSFPHSKFTRQEHEHKRHSRVLVLAVYTALLVLASQMIGLISFMIFGKFPPGFIFLMTALLFLGCISFKVMAYDSVNNHGFKEVKRKAE